MDTQLQIIDVRAVAVVQLDFEREWFQLADVGRWLPVLDGITVKSPICKCPWELKSVCLEEVSMSAQKVSVCGLDHD